MGNIGSQVGGWPVQAADATALWDKLVGGRAQRESGAIIVYPQSTGDAGSRQVRPRSVGWWVGRRCGGESGASVVPYAPSHPLSPPPPPSNSQFFNNGYWTCSVGVCIDKNVDDIGFLEQVGQSLLFVLFACSAARAPRHAAPPA